MRVEICIAKEKISKMPKGSVPALQQEMLRRIGKRYDDADVIVKSASNDGFCGAGGGLCGIVWLYADF